MRLAAYKNILMRQQEKQKKEVEKNKEDIQKEELEQLCSSETASISPAVIPENYLDRAILNNTKVRIPLPQRSRQGLAPL